jgi:hypothetical protein
MGEADSPGAAAGKPIDEIVVENTITWLERHGHLIAYGLAALLTVLFVIGHFVWGFGWSALVLPLVIAGTTRLIRWRSELWTFFLPAALLIVMVLAGATVQHGLLFCSEPTLGLPLPSERAISTAILRQPISEKDQVYRFRYEPTGTEGRAGIPYWIFRIMPRLFDKEMNHQGYKFFGFDDDDGGPYFQHRAGDSQDGTSFKMPRGAVLVDTGFDLPLFHFKVGLKRVALNCSACHRGKVMHDDGTIELYDGMPNHTANLQAFKRFFSTAIDDPRFNPDAVVAEIDKALQEDGQEKLNATERWAYAGIVDVMKQLGKDKTGKWQDTRPPNGPGRIDPFNAVKFEVLRVDDDSTVATLDFPAIWNQSATFREWHHYDGNTKSSEARNYGSVIGVGGFAVTVHKDTIDQVGKWIDDMHPPRYPFGDNTDKTKIASGQVLFEAHCKYCHGTYDRELNTIAKGDGYMKPHKDIGTDGERLRAFRQPTADALDAFGDRRQLWPADAFRAQEGYFSGPLDGIWARAPYLHNGSVPTLFHLLQPKERPDKFCRGNPKYDKTKGGFVWESDHDKCDRPDGLYDTSKTGNHNTGHVMSVPFSPSDVENLIAYLKTL